MIDQISKSAFKVGYLLLAVVLFYKFVEYHLRILLVSAGLLLLLDMHLAFHIFLLLMMIIELARLPIVAYGGARLHIS